MLIIMLNIAILMLMLMLVLIILTLMYLKYQIYEDKENQVSFLQQ